MLAKNLVLASTSSSRQKLFESTGLRFETCRSKVDEATIVGQHAYDTALKRAKAKSLAVTDRWSESLIIGADQTLECEGETFHKPRSVDDARYTLQQLQDHHHTLHSAVSVIYVDSTRNVTEIASFVTPAHLTVRHLSNAQIENYLALEEWKGCVGAYRMEGVGSHLFEWSDERGYPDQSTILGLPLGKLLQVLRRIGIDGLTALSPPWTIDVSAEQS